MFDEHKKGKTRDVKKGKSAPTYIHFWCAAEDCHSFKSVWNVSQLGSAQLSFGRADALLPTVVDYLSSVFFVDAFHFLGTCSSPLFSLGVGLRPKVSQTSFYTEKKGGRGRCGTRRIEILPPRIISVA